MGMESVFWHGLYRRVQQTAWGQGELLGISSLTFTFRIFRVKVDSKVMRYLRR